MTNTVSTMTTMRKAGVSLVSRPGDCMGDSRHGRSGLSEQFLQETEESEEEEEAALDVQQGRQSESDRQELREQERQLEADGP